MGLMGQLGISPGVTSVVGSGGKTTLLAALAREAEGTCVLTTTTHTLPFEGVPTLVSPTEDEVAHALGASRVVCVGGRAPGGKLAAGGPACDRLARIAEHVLVEADGSRRLPLKAHAPWEPVIPEGSRLTVLVVGASGFGAPVRDAAHRPETFCALAGCEPHDPATPELVARVLRSEGLADVVVVNQADTDELVGLARELARRLEVPVLAGSLREGALLGPLS